MEKNKAGAPKGNKNAEKWTLEQSIELFENAMKLASDKNNESNDFIGEIAQDLKVTLSTLEYLKNKYKDQLEPMYRDIKSLCEANCFRNGKKNNINASLAIMNLKSNHGWTDRLHQENTGEVTIKQVTGMKID